MKKLLIRSLLLLSVCIAIWLALSWPRFPVHRWTPPTPPQSTGILSPNQTLLSTKMLGDSTMIEPEDNEVDAQGRIYGGCLDGKIRRINKDGKTEVFAITNGRPLGLKFAKDGTLYVADAFKGLLAIDKKGKVTTLAIQYKGKQIKYADDLDLDAEGNIYFSDASQLIDYSQSASQDIISRNPTGRLFKYNPKTKKLTLLLDKLYFANGVVLSHDGNSILINETGNFSTRRYWIKGAKAGTHEHFATNYPGYPDNINRSSDGGYWISLVSPRKASLEADMHNKLWLKKLILSLPSFIMPKADQSGSIIKVNAKGKIIKSLQDPKGQVIHNITSANERNGYLYIGHIYQHKSGIGKLKLHP